MTTEFACRVQRNTLAIEFHQALSGLIDSAQTELHEHWHENSSRYNRRIAVFGNLIEAL